MPKIPMPKPLSELELEDKLHQLRLPLDGLDKENTKHYLSKEGSEMTDRDRLIHIIAAHGLTPGIVITPTGFREAKCICGAVLVSSMKTAIHDEMAMHIADAILDTDKKVSVSSE